MAWDVFTGGTPPVEVPGSASGHDLTILAGPVWGGRPAPPLRGYVRRYAPEAPIVLLLTCGGTSPRYPGEKALEELAGLLKTPPVATGLFKEEQIKAPSLPEAVAGFATTLRATAGR